MKYEEWIEYERARLEAQREAAAERLKTEEQRARGESAGEGADEVEADADEGVGGDRSQPDGGVYPA